MCTNYGTGAEIAVDDVTHAETAVDDVTQVFSSLLFFKPGAEIAVDDVTHAETAVDDVTQVFSSLLFFKPGAEIAVDDVTHAETAVDDVTQVFSSLLFFKPGAEIAVDDVTHAETAVDDVTQVFSSLLFFKPGAEIAVDDVTHAETAVDDVTQVFSSLLFFKPGCVYFLLANCARSYLWILPRPSPQWPPARQLRPPGSPTAGSRGGSLCRAFSIRRKHLEEEIKLTSLKGSKLPANVTFASDFTLSLISVSVSPPLCSYTTDSSLSEKVGRSRRSEKFLALTLVQSLSAVNHSVEGSGCNRIRGEEIFNHALCYLLKSCRLAILSVSPCSDYKETRSRSPWEFLAVLLS